MSVTRTRTIEMSTRTHTLVGLHNPYLICDECKVTVRYWHNPERCDCDDDFYNHPCLHKTGVTSICSTWGPVDGCICVDKVNHDKD